MLCDTADMSGVSRSWITQTGFYFCRASATSQDMHICIRMYIHVYIYTFMGDPGVGALLLPPSSMQHTPLPALFESMHDLHDIHGKTGLAGGPIEPLGRRALG